MAKARYKVYYKQPNGVVCSMVFQADSVGEAKALFMARCMNQGYKYISATKLR